MVTRDVDRNRCGHQDGAWQWRVGFNAQTGSLKPEGAPLRADTWVKDSCGPVDAVILSRSLTGHLTLKKINDMSLQLLM